MTRKLLEFVYKIRMAIYILGIVVFAFSACRFTKADENTFWPPDMIPHPNPPWEQPSDPNDEMVDKE